MSRTRGGTVRARRRSGGVRHGLRGQEHLQPDREPDDDDPREPPGDTGGRDRGDHDVARRGVSTTFVDTLDYGAYEDAIDEDTAFLHVETIGNPALVTPDLVRLSVGLEAVDAIIDDLDGAIETATR